MQLQEFVSSPNIIFNDIKSENAINLWQSGFFGRESSRQYDNYIMCSRYPDYRDWYKMHFIMFQQLCKELNLNCPFNVVEDVIFDEVILARKIMDQNFDFLIVNSYCWSGQIQYSPQQQDLLFLNIINNLKQNNKTFITTKKLLDYPCTTDFNLSLVQIGQLAKNCKCILGVLNAPFFMCMNKFAINKFEQVFMIVHLDSAFEFGDRFQLWNPLK